MDGTTADIREISVPGGDGAIAQALVSLDERLAAWAAAMREACRQLADASMRRESAAAESRSDGSLPPPSTVIVAERASTDTSPSAANEPQTRTEAAVGFEVPAAAQPSGEATIHEPVPPSGAIGEAPAASVVAPDGVSGSVATEPQGPTAVEDDNAVLASLDAETAQAIRVMRRLSPAHRSVRDLLAEYEASKTTQLPSQTGKKKSWFSKGRS